MHINSQELKNNLPFKKRESYFGSLPPKKRMLSDTAIGNLMEETNKNIIKIVTKTGLLYKGEHSNNIPNGKGMLIYKNNKTTYEGNFIDGKPNGMGTFKWKNSGNTYTGEVLDGQMHGQGKFIFKEGNIISGSFLNGSFLKP